MLASLGEVTPIGRLLGRAEMAFGPQAPAAQPSHAAEQTDEH
jgi:hypothetical protein